MARPADRAVRSIFAFLRSKAKDAASIPRANLISNDNFFFNEKRTLRYNRTYHYQIIHN